MVVGLSMAIDRLSLGAATALFMAYSAINGLTLSSIFLIYTSTSIAWIFFITAGMFGVMSLYGYVTKRDLTRVGTLLVMGLIGFSIASIVNVFLKSAALYWIVTDAGVLIFVGLTASDTQKMKRLSEQATDDSSARRFAILGSLTLTWTLSICSSCCGSSAAEGIRAVTHRIDADVKHQTNDALVAYRFLFPQDITHAAIETDYLPLALPDSRRH